MQLPPEFGPCELSTSPPQESLVRGGPPRSSRNSLERAGDRPRKITPMGGGPRGGAVSAVSCEAAVVPALVDASRSDV